MSDSIDAVTLDYPWESTISNSLMTCSAPEQVYTWYNQLCFVAMYPKHNPPISFRISSLTLCRSSDRVDTLVVYPYYVKASPKKHTTAQNKAQTLVRFSRDLLHIDGLMQKRRNSIADAPELRLFCIKSSFLSPLVCIYSRIKHSIGAMMGTIFVLSGFITTDCR